MLPEGKTVVMSKITPAVISGIDNMNFLPKIFCMKGSIGIITATMIGGNTNTKNMFQFKEGVL